LGFLGEILDFEPMPQQNFPSILEKGCKAKFCKGRGQKPKLQPKLPSGTVELFTKETSWQRSPLVFPATVPVLSKIALNKHRLSFPYSPA
jgi:hypothetical protein